MIVVVVYYIVKKMTDILINNVSKLFYYSQMERIF